MSQAPDAIADLGLLALGSRLRRVSDTLMSSVAVIYERADVDFQPRWFPLFRLLTEREAVRVTEAAALLGVTHPNVTQLSRELELAELVISDVDRSDQRRRVLRLTARGRRMADQLQPTWTDLEAAMEGVSREIGFHVTTVLRQLELALEEVPLVERVRRTRRDRLSAQLEIVPWDPQDAQRCARAFAQLNFEWIERHFEVEPEDRRMLEHPVEEVLRPGGMIWFARIGADVVGTAALVPHASPPSPQRDSAFPIEMELAKMAVTPAAQGLGAGRKLAETAIEWARRIGLRRISLVTHSSLTTAITLYKRLGFRNVLVGHDRPYHRADTAMVLDLDNVGESNPS